MEYVVLTQYSGKILGPIAKFILGPILNGIFIFLNWLPWKNSANVGVAIILFTIVIYILLLPLTIKQQKFSKLQAKMNPEIEEIRKKYKNRKDQDSQMAMNQEIQTVYSKYGVSPTGSCAQLLIQMPILFALYRVIYSIPAYVPMVKGVFSDLVTKLIGKGSEATEVIQNLKSAGMFTKQFTSEAFTSGDFDTVSNTYIDVLNRASSAEWDTLLEKFPDLSSTITDTMENLKGYNNFLGLNIGYSPKDIIVNAWASHAYLIIFFAILIPVLSAVTQWVNVKLTPNANANNNNGDQADQMAALSKSMAFMPIISAIFCFTLPAGMGIYWIAGSVVRSIQQVIINKHIDKIDLDAEIKKNVEKRNARLRKAGIDPEKLAQRATQSTKSVNYSYSYDSNKKSISQKAMLNGKPIEEADVSKSSTDYNNKNASKAGSLASKANMVKQYNERNNK